MIPASLPHRVALLVSLGVLLAACGSNPGPAPKPGPASPGSASPRRAWPAFRAPDTPRGDLVETLHGERVPAPYRWLEQASDARADWLERQRLAARELLDALPQRPAFLRRLRALWRHDSETPPVRRGERLFFKRHDGVAPHPLLVVQDGEEPPRLLLEPATLGEGLAVVDTSPSPDGSLLAYAVSERGSDWQRWRVREVASGRDLAHEVRWCKWSPAAWTADSRGFFYARYPAPKEDADRALANRHVCYHRVDQPQSEDRLIYRDPEHPRRGCNPWVSADGRLLVIDLTDGATPDNRLLWGSLADGVERLTLAPLIGDGEASYRVIGSRGERVWLQTTAGAPRGRVVSLRTADPAPRPLREVLAEQADPLTVAWLRGGGLLCLHQRSGRARLALFDRDSGALTRRIELPAEGSVRGFDGLPDQRQTWFSFRSYSHPPSVYQLDLATGARTLRHRPELPFDSARYVERVVQAPADDGEPIPVVLVHRRDIALDGSHPTYLYVYGGFNVTLPPRFGPGLAAWLEAGGVYAVAQVRGGGAKGRPWHEAARGRHKQRTFDDVACAARHLIELGLTRAGRIAVGGRSNGGLVAAATMLQHPQLFGAADVRVALLDMLRYHTFTIGHAWTKEFGSPADPEAFRWLRAYSPLHNTRPARYPATLISAAANDDRVVPAHSYKFAAALQHAQRGPAPIVLRVAGQAGHGPGLPLAARQAAAADRWAFLWHALRAP